jgi:hypothetical protein
MENSGSEYPEKIRNSDSPPMNSNPLKGILNWFSSLLGLTEKELEEAGIYRGDPNFIGKENINDK